MTPKKIEARYLTLREIAEDSGRQLYEVGNWARYHRYFPLKKIFGKPVVDRLDYERFKSEHPELIKQPIAA